MKYVVTANIKEVGAPRESAWSETFDGIPEEGASPATLAQAAVDKFNRVAGPTTRKREVVGVSWVRVSDVASLITSLTEATIEAAVDDIEVLTDLEDKLDLASQKVYTTVEGGEAFSDDADNDDEDIDL